MERKQKTLTTLQHNEKIKRQMFKDEVKRWKVLKRHEDTILPFIDQKVKDVLDKFATVKSDCNNNDSNNGSSNGHVQKLKQPSIVKTQLRDYQLVGLNWMMGMHNNGMGMILGDEMGLVRTGMVP